MAEDFWGKFNAFLFDFDGTLCDTEPDIKGAWRSVFRNLGIECPQFERIFRTGPSLKQITAELFPESGESFQKGVISRFGECYDGSGFPLTKPYPGIEAKLLLLKEEGKRVFIVTNKRLKPIQLLLKKLHWEQLFSGVYTPDRNGMAESKQQLIAALLKEHAVPAEEAVMIGDTPGDAAAGKSCGVKTCGVLWGYSPEEALLDADTDYLFELKDWA